MENPADNRASLPDGAEHWPDSTKVQQEVAEVTSGIREATDESTLGEKVEALRQSLEDIGHKVYAWREKDYYIEAINDLKQQVDGIQQEWKTLSEGMQGQRERLESLLQAFPGVIETSTLRALLLRVRHLEELVDELINERQHKVTAERARKQLNVSIVALVVTVIFWGIFIVLRFLPS